MKSGTIASVFGRLGERRSKGWWYGIECLGIMEKYMEGG